MTQRKKNCRTEAFKSIAMIMLLLTMKLGFAEASNVDVVSEAKAKFESGIEKFGQENYPGALTEFEASYALRKSPIVLYNIGMCQKALFRYPESMATFKTLSALPDLEEAIQTGIEAAIKEMKALSGQLNLVDAPASAEVAINGKPVGTTPLQEPIYLAPGNHNLMITKDGYEPLVSTISLNQAQVLNVRAALKQPKTILRVDCPKGAGVALNEAFAGNCPYESEVTPGLIKVTVTAPGKPSVVEHTTVKAGSTANVTIRLEEAIVVKTVEKKAKPMPLPQRKPPVFLITGASATALGVAGLSVGIIFTARWHRHRNELVDIIEKVNLANESQNKPLFEQYLDEYLLALEQLKTDIHPKDRAGMIAGFTVGSVLTAAGATLLILHAVKKNRAKKTAVSPIPGGIAVRF